MKKKCPNCNAILPDEKTQSWPFCSTRCRMIDLGKWMNEEYRVPVEGRQNSQLEEDEET